MKIDKITEQNKYDPVEYIREKLDEGELFAQLAEECAELGKAALKLRRVYHGKNPTPVTAKEAHRNLMEEIADVSLCLEVLGLNSPAAMVDVQNTMNMKVHRWALRLGEVECPVCGETINVKLKECPNCRVYQHNADDFLAELEEEY